MGASMIFTFGNAESMKQALLAEDYRHFYNLLLFKADLSLHLQLHDLQSLTECASVYASAPLPDFEDSLDYQLDEPDRQLCLVKRGWVTGMASVGKENAAQLTADWYQKLAENYPDKKIPAPPPPVLRAVSDLIAICAHTLRQDQRLIYIWLAPED